MPTPEISGVLIGVELGGTKILVASSTTDLALGAREQVPTTDPETTLAAVREAIGRVTQGRRIVGLGIASFGPVDLRRVSDRFGEILSTPKVGWSGVNVVDALAEGLDVPVGTDTDVNAALLAEKTMGAGRFYDTVAYLTVGTGVGGGIWSDGSVLHGANHPEIGHIRVQRHGEDQHESSCPFHDDCLEGMASGPAVEQRWGTVAESLDRLSDAATRLEAWYLARGIAGLCSVVPVDVVIIGGGLSKLPGLHAEIAKALNDASGLYPPVPFAEGGPVIIPPELGDDAGVLGALLLARSAM
ncbi:MAG: ROK family protein [Acidimicrobiia bacterium]|nr:MAG: ROK family protein [Acidimicrobiia bacterium]